MFQQCTDTQYIPGVSGSFSLAVKRVLSVVVCDSMAPRTFSPSFSWSISALLFKTSWWRHRALTIPLWSLNCTWEGPFTTPLSNIVSNIVSNALSHTTQQGHTHLESTQNSRTYNQYKIPEWQSLGRVGRVYHASNSPPAMYLCTRGWK